jgi:hypothetical protein
MKKNLALISTASLASIFFTGCTSDFLGSSKPSQTDYAVEKQNIKTSVKSQASLETKIHSLQKKYGISPIDMRIGANQPEIIKPAPCAACPKTQMTMPLPKSADIQYDIFGIKSVSATIERPYYEQFYVPAGQSITVTVTGTQPSIDPFLVIYNITQGSLTDYQSQQKMAVVGWNDDYSGLNSRVATGTFSTSTYVVVLAFAYDAYSKGMANISIQIGGTTLTRPNVWIKGTAIFHDNYESQYIDKTGALVNVLANGWTQYLPGTTVFNAADYNYWNGEYNWGTYKPACSGDTYIWAFNLTQMKGMANDDSPGGLCSSLLNDASWTSFPSGYHYPNFALLGGYSEGGQSTFLQIAAFQK